MIFYYSIEGITKFIIWISLGARGWDITDFLDITDYAEPGLDLDLLELA